MSERPNPKGWEELQVLPSRTPDNRLVVDLRDQTSLLFLENGRAYLVRVRPAPDGQYELQRSGKLVVRNGQLQEVLGFPDAVASVAVSP